jgi:large exoprotein involved in heme utilization and adhesion
VGINSDGLVFDGIGLTRSDVEIANGSSISVSANQNLNPVDPVFSPMAISPGSSINISANQIDLSNSGTRFISGVNNPTNQAFGGLDAGLEVNAGAKTGTIGNINLNATGDINLNQSAIFNLVRSGATGTGGGIKLTGNNINITNKSEISTSLAKDATGSGGNIDITAQGNFNFAQSNYPDVITALLDAGTESTAESVIAASTYGRGDSGKITITAGGNAVVSDNSAISSSVLSTGIGSSGGIKVDANSLTVRNGGQLLTSAEGIANQPETTKHNSGNIDVTTKGDVTIFGSNTINDTNANNNDRFARIESNNFRTGDAGQVNITAGGKLSILNRSEISSSIRKGGNGTGGGINLNAQEFLLSNLSYITSYLGGRSLGKREPNAQGQSGDININAIGDITIDETLPKLIVKEFEGSKTTPSLITNSIHGTGKGGKIAINTLGKVTVGSHDGIVNTVEPGGEGDPGGITIKAGELEVYNEGQILTVASKLNQGKRGSAGNIDIETTGNVTVAGNRNPNLISSPAAIANNGKSDIGYAKIASNSFRNGDAGTITIDAGGNVSIINKGSLATKCLDECKSQLGNKAGSIDISSNRLIFDRGDISLNANDNAGNIKINAQDLMLMRRNSSIVTNSEGAGNGGNIAIDSKFILATRDNNDITANAIKGQGGNVQINAQGVFGIQFRAQRNPNTSDITASSDFGQSGNVQINTPGVDPAKDKGELAAVPNDASSQISQVCSASNRQNKLTVTGRGGLPPNANDPLIGDVVWQDARAIEDQPTLNSGKNQPLSLTPPAIGWVFDAQGKVTLIAASGPGQPTKTTVTCPNVSK